jgi:uncharacterized protein (TIGR03435 family)
MILLRTAVLAAVCSLAFAQPPADSPRFEVASLKPSDPNGQGGGIIRPMPGFQVYMATRMPLRTMMMVAYTVRDSQISGGPSWFGADLYDMNAKAEKPSTPDELHVMLQNLLADRCRLKIHKESKEVSGWALVVDKDGPKFKAHDAEDKDHPPIRPMGPGKAQGVNANMDLLRLFISRGLDSPIVDKTGLAGYYDYTIEITPERITGPDGQDRLAPPDVKMISDALKAQLGLRLDPVKTSVDRIIIDHVEKPSEN